jgi:hypothetical protein
MLLGNALNSLQSVSLVTRSTVEYITNDSLPTRWLLKRYSDQWIIFVTSYNSSECGIFPSHHELLNVIKFLCLLFQSWVEHNGIKRQYLVTLYCGACVRVSGARWLHSNRRQFIALAMKTVLLFGNIFGSSFHQHYWHSSVSSKQPLAVKLEQCVWKPIFGSPGDPCRIFDRASLLNRTPRDQSSARSHPWYFRAEFELIYSELDSCNPEHKKYAVYHTMGGTISFTYRITLTGNTKLLSLSKFRITSGQHNFSHWTCC